MTPLCYDSNLKTFGYDIKPNINFGNKYEFKVNDVPPPGYYNPENGIDKLRPRSPTVIFYEETRAD